MSTVIKLIGYLGTAVVVIALVGVLFGWHAVSQGRKNDNPQKVDQGIEAMVMGGITAAVAGSIVTAIIANLNNLPK